MGSIFLRRYFEEFVDIFYTNLPIPHILTQSGLLEKGEEREGAAEERIIYLTSKIWLECQLFHTPAGGF